MTLGFVTSPWVRGAVRHSQLSTTTRSTKRGLNANKAQKNTRQTIKADTDAPPGGGPGRRPGTKPKAPQDFKAPQPRRFYVRPDNAPAVLASSLGLATRLGAGAVVAGYRIKFEDGKVVEYSATLPRERPSTPLEVYEFEACPFCRKVREAISMLDIDAVFYPCPKGSKIYRPKVVEMGGKAQFPYIVDPNTGFKGYESDDIISYLFKTYADGNVPLQLSLGPLTTLSAGLASVLRSGHGNRRASATVTASQPLELWAYEASPFCKVVRERLCELELPYLLHTTARGSPQRKELERIAGSFQVPYLVDGNTGVSMFESAEIIEYLDNTYGPNAPGASAEPTGDAAEGLAKASTITVGATAVAKPEVVDKALEDYCKENPDAEECRVYDE